MGRSYISNLDPSLSLPNLLSQRHYLPTYYFELFFFILFFLSR